MPCTVCVIHRSYTMYPIHSTMPLVMLCTYSLTYSTRSTVPLSFPLRRYTELFFHANDASHCIPYDSRRLSPCHAGTPRCSHPVSYEPHHARCSHVTCMCLDAFVRHALYVLQCISPRPTRWFVRTARCSHCISHGSVRRFTYICHVVSERHVGRGEPCTYSTGVFSLYFIRSTKPSYVHPVASHSIHVAMPRRISHAPRGLTSCLVRTPLTFPCVSHHILLHLI